MSDPMQPEQQDLAAHAYDKIEWHTINIQDLNKRLQNISDTVVRMDERWVRSDEAIRSFMAAWFRDERDKVDTCLQTRSCLFTDWSPHHVGKLNDYNKARGGRQPTII